MRSERDANLSLVPIAPSWAEPSRCVRRVVHRTRARMLYLIPLAVAILGAAYLGV